MTETNSTIMNLITQFWKWLKDKNGWVAMILKILIPIVIALIVALTLTSCGVSRAKVINGAAGTTTSVTITNENESSPNISVKAVIRDLNKYKSKKRNKDETEENAEKSE